MADGFWKRYRKCFVAASILTAAFELLLDNFTSESSYHHPGGSDFKLIHSHIKSVFTTIFGHHTQLSFQSMSTFLLARSQIFFLQHGGVQQWKELRPAAG